MSSKSLASSVDTNIYCTICCKNKKIFEFSANESYYIKWQESNLDIIIQNNYSYCMFSHNKLFLIS